MRGRVADLGGRLAVTSAPGRGTVLRVEVPAQR
jgi:signal transduction histidine kinase